MSNNPYGSYAVSTDISDEGIWAEEPDFRVRTRFAGAENKRYWAEFVKVMAPVQATMRKLENNPELLDKFDKNTVTPKLARLFVDHIITDWQSSAGFDEELGDIRWLETMVSLEGEAVPYDPDVALKILLRFPRVFQRIREVAGNASLFASVVQEADEGTVKNSLTPSHTD